MKILIAEDDKDMAKILKIYLEKNGYAVDNAFDGEEAIDKLTQDRYDAVLLDWMMPRISGIEVCEFIKKNNIPIKIMMLTANEGSAYEIRGLTIGADDYLKKPFDIDILLIRLKKLVGADEILYHQNLTLNKISHQVHVNDNLIRLTPIEFDLLKYFLENKTIVLTREMLINKIWGFDFEGDWRTVDTHIKRLRQKIGGDKIKTHIGIGYEMVNSDETL